MRHRNHSQRAAFLVATISLLVPPSVQATGSHPAAAHEDERVQAEAPGVGDVSLEYSGTVGASLIAGAIAAAVLPTEISKTPPSCRWCGGASPNAIDRWASGARWEDPCRAGGISNKTLGVAAVVALLPMSHHARSREWLVNAGAATESVAVTVMLTQITKYVVRRERPRPSTCHPDRATESDRNLSFFSGHTAVAFALVASAHETARLRGQPTNDWIWVGGAAAVATGYLRVAADRHHLIDVLAGAGVGYLVGRWVPRHLHHPSSPRPGSRSEPLVRARQDLIGPPLLGITKSMTSGNRRLLVRLGSGPGRSLQLGVSF